MDSDGGVANGDGTDVRTKRGRGLHHNEMLSQTRDPHDTAHHVVRTAVGLGAAAVVGAAVAMVLASPLGERLTRELGGARRPSAGRPDEPSLGLEVDGAALFV